MHYPISQPQEPCEGFRSDVIGSIFQKRILRLRKSDMMMQKVYRKPAWKLGYSNLGGKFYITWDILILKILIVYLNSNLTNLFILYFV